MVSADQTTALDIVTVVVAGYAALVGTLALAFQAVSWFRSWSTRVEVKLGRYELATPNLPSEPIILFRLTNHSSHAVKITSVGFGPQRRGGQGFIIARPWPLEMALPVPIRPRDSQQVWTKPEFMPETLDLDGKVQAVVTTSDGKLFKSKKVRVRSLVESEAK